MNVAIGSPDDNDLLDALAAMSKLVLHARHEEDFLEGLSRALFEFVQCDAVILRLLERHIQTRAVATRDGVSMLPPDQLWEPFTQADRELWLARSEGIHCRDIAVSPHIKPTFRNHAARLGLNSGFMVPIIRDGDIHGQIIFAWSVSAALTQLQKERLRKLTGYAGLQLTLFNMRQGRELDDMTGLLNRFGLRRRWELAVQQPRGIVFFVEMIGLRSVTDARGRLAPEDWLRQTARLLLDVSGPQVSVARYGDNEFVLLAPTVTSSRADQFRQSFLEGFDELAVTLPPPHPRCGVGIASWPGDGKDLQQLIVTAERRLNDQKRRHIKLTMTTKRSVQNGRMLRTLMDGWLATSSDGILIADPDRKTMYVNRAYERMSGYSLQQWLGKTPGFIASGKTPPALYEEMWRKLETEGAWMGQLVNRHRLGHEWISFLSVTKILDRSGRLAGYLGIARDITAGTADGLKGGPGAAFQQSFTETILALALAKAGFMHEGIPGANFERIRDFTHVLVARAAERGWPALQSYEYRSAIVSASILHDIGNLCLPQAVLRKPGKLSEEEWELMKTHTDAGRQLLQSSYLRGHDATTPSLFVMTAANIAAYHHERWDGRGYPRGLSGEDIPLEARIVAVADVYDALRSRRPYKSAWSHSEAVAYIENEAGSHFDPAIVGIFVSLHDEFDELCARDNDIDSERSHAG